MAKLPNDDYDGAWKAALGVYLQEFLALCFPAMRTILIRDELSWCCTADHRRRSSSPANRCRATAPRRCSASPDEHRRSPSWTPVPRRALVVREPMRFLVFDA